MLGCREPDDPAPPPVPEWVRREVQTESEAERLERLLAGLVVTRPSDDAVSAALLKRNLVVTQLSA